LPNRASGGVVRGFRRGFAQGCKGLQGAYPTAYPWGLRHSTRAHGGKGYAKLERFKFEVLSRRGGAQGLKVAQLDAVETP